MKVLLALLVVLGWGATTTAVAWAMPQRDDPDELPDLIYDPHFMLSPPPNPVEKDHLPARPTTTPPPPPAPKRVVRPRPPPAPEVAAPSPAPGTYPPGVEQWRGLVSQYPWPVDTMLSIMRCESGGNPLARNRSGASGLFQLLPGPTGWQDPATNIRLAYEMKYRPSGLSPWNASRGCWG